MPPRPRPPRIMVVIVMDLTLTRSVALVLLLAYMKGNANLCRAIVRAGARLGVTNNQGVNIFNYQVATKQLLFRLLGEFCSVVVAQAGGRRPGGGARAGGRGGAGGRGQIGCRSLSERWSPQLPSCHLPRPGLINNPVDRSPLLVWTPPPIM